MAFASEEDFENFNKFMYRITLRESVYGPKIETTNFDNMKVVGEGSGEEIKESEEDA